MRGIDVAKMTKGRDECINSTDLRASWRAIYVSLLVAWLAWGSHDFKFFLI